MASVHDVAAYIVDKQGAMTAMKLQKLVYYCQAWAVVWESRPLFEARIEAWANGPVVGELYAQHRGQFEIREWPSGRADRLTDEDRAIIDDVLEFYGGRSAQWLSELTHREEPWLRARSGLGLGERGNHEITLSSLEEYYGSLVD